MTVPHNSDPPNNSDRRLIISRVLDSHRAYLKTVVRARLSPLVRSREDSSDVVQLATAEAWQKLDQGKGPALEAEPRAIRAWLREVAVNTLFRIVRWHGADKRNPKHECNGFADENSGTVSKGFVFPCYDSQNSPSQIAISAETADQVRNTLSQLKPRDRQILVWRFIHQWTLTQIAEQLGLSITAASKACEQAAERFRSLFKN